MRARVYMLLKKEWLRVQFAHTAVDSHLCAHSRVFTVRPESCKVNNQRVLSIKLLYKMEFYAHGHIKCAAFTQ